MSSLSFCVIPLCTAFVPFVLAIIRRPSIAFTTISHPQFMLVSVSHDFALISCFRLFYHCNYSCSFPHLFPHLFPYLPVVGSGILLAYLHLPRQLLQFPFPFLNQNATALINSNGSKHEDSNNDRGNDNGWDGHV